MSKRNNNPSLLTLASACLLVIVTFLIATSIQTNQNQTIKTKAEETTPKCPSGMRPKLVCPEIEKTPPGWLKLSPTQRQEMKEQKRKELCNWQCLPLSTRPITGKPTGRPIPTISPKPTVTVRPWPTICPVIICPLRCVEKAEPLLENCPICHCELLAK